MEKRTKTNREKYYDSFDLFKFIASFVVMIVHLNPFGESHFHWLHPWVRIVIPVYFMISAFLFFSKYDSLPKEKQSAYLLNFIKRNLILYLFWFIVFLPFTIVYRDYFHKGIVFFIGSILLGSTFPASWYIIALVIAIIIVSKLDTGIGRFIVPVIAFLFYLFCLGQNTWRVLADKTAFLPNIYNATAISYTASFFVAIIWIWLGRLFVKNQEQVLAADMKKTAAAFITSLVLLFFEDKWLFDRGLFTKNNDAYLFGLLAGPLLFMIIVKINIRVSSAKWLQSMSTLIYCFHASFGECLRVYVFTPRVGYEFPWAALCFLITAVVTVLVSCLILKYSEKVKILKYAYRAPTRKDKTVSYKFQQFILSI